MPPQNDRPPVFTAGIAPRPHSTGPDSVPSVVAAAAHHRSLWSTILTALVALTAAILLLNSCDLIRPKLDEHTIKKFEMSLQIKDIWDAKEIWKSIVSVFLWPFTRLTRLADLLALISAIVTLLRRRYLDIRWIAIGTFGMILVALLFSSPDRPVAPKPDPLPAPAPPISTPLAPIPRSDQGLPPKAKVSNSPSKPLQRPSLPVATPLLDGNVSCWLKDGSSQMLSYAECRRVHGVLQ